MKDRGFKFVIFFMLFLVPISVYADPASTDPVIPDSGETTPTVPETPSDSNTTSDSNQNNTTSSNNSQNTNTGDVIYQQNQNTSRSTNANLGSLKIDGVEVSISNEMYATTGNENPSIVAIPSSDKASIKIDKPDKFVYGDNIVTITVTAENFYVVKTYTLHLKLVSTDATLKSLKIDGKKVKIKNKIECRTDKKKLDIESVTNNKNATVVYENADNLKLGKNKVIVKVTAEDGVTIKEYIINVTRVKHLIGDVGVTVKVNGKEADFKNYKSKIIYIDNEVSKINIDYKLSDKYAEINLKYDKNIEVGDKKITFTVTAENGKKQEYVLNIHRFSILEEILASGIGVCIMGVFAFLVFFIVKKIIKERSHRIYKVKL